MESLAVVIPVYRSKETVKELVSELKQIWKDRGSCHIFLVDDGNREDVVDYLKKYCLSEHVTMISLKQNYGQQMAVLCGLRHCTGFDLVAVLDDDKAHPVSLLLPMQEKLSQGYDLVYGIPELSAEYSLGSRGRDLLFRWLLGCPKGKKVSSFRLMKGELTEKIAAWQGSFFYFSASALQLTKRIENITYRPSVEKRRSSGYTLWKRLKLFADIFFYYGLHLGKATAENPQYEEQALYPRLMVLGGSQCQLHALQWAKKEQMYTVLADYTKAPAGARIADVHEPVSTFDWEGCVQTAKKHEIQGIMTMGTDQPVYTAAKVSEELGLPCCLTPEQALLVTNKKYMKQRMAEAGIPAVPWMLVDETTKPEELRKLKPPYVIKPLDSQGQRGIFKLNTPEEVLAHLPETLSFSRCREALVEEFYESDEMTVSGYIDHGKLIILTVTDRLLYPDPVHIGVCIGHRFPSVHMADYEKIKEISDALVESFGLPNGPFYLQLLTGDKGIRVNELACRIGGAFEDVIIPWLTGFDLLEAVMKNALGHPVNVDKWRNFRCDRVEKSAAVQLLFCHPGKIQSVTPEEELRTLPFVLDCGYNYQTGSTIPVMENATARFGHAVITGTGEEISKNIDTFYKKLQVTGEAGEAMINRLYPEE